MTKQDIRNLFSTDEAFKDFEKKFNQDDKIKVLRNSISNLQRAFKIVQAQQLQKKLCQIEYNAAKYLLEEEKRRKTQYIQNQYKKRGY